MPQSEFEKELKRRILRRRLIMLAVFVVFLALGIIFTVLYQNSRQEVPIGDSSHTRVTYNYDFISGQVVGYVVAGYTAIFLFADLISMTLKTVQAGGSDITIYRGLFKVALYIDCELHDTIFAFRHYLEGKLKDNTMVHVSLGRYSGRMVFTNGHAPIDIDYWFSRD